MTEAALARTIALACGPQIHGRKGINLKGV